MRVLISTLRLGNERLEYGGSPLTKPPRGIHRVCCRLCDRTTLFYGFDLGFLQIRLPSSCDLIRTDGVSVHACGDYRIWFCMSCLNVVPLDNQYSVHVSRKWGYEPSSICPTCSSTMLQRSVSEVNNGYFWAR